MNFRRAEPSFQYRSLRFVSDGGRWELGLSPYSQGVRLRMGLAGRPPSVLDFCLGHETAIFLPVLTAVMKRLEALEETASSQEIDAVFPWAGTRPELAVHLSQLLTDVTASSAPLP